ncbi:hypothetical protein ACPZ8D_27825, partial [Klebsiella pneumoniae subsp. pneumoniae]
LLCHGTVCVVGKMRDLILQLSKSSIYSTKPQDVSCKEAEEITADGAVSADHFIWHPVTRVVGNVKSFTHGDSQLLAHSCPPCQLKKPGSLWEKHR